MLPRRQNDNEDESKGAKAELSQQFRNSFSLSLLFAPRQLSLFLSPSCSCMAVPREMARPLGPRMFALPVGGKENRGAGYQKTATLFSDIADEENVPSTSSSVPPEWALVELQGEVQPPAGAGPEDSFTAGRLVLKVGVDCGVRERKSFNLVRLSTHHTQLFSKKKTRPRPPFNNSKQNSQTAASSSSWATICSRAPFST